LTFGELDTRVNERCDFAPIICRLQYAPLLEGGVTVEHLIAKLLEGFEQGKMSRRQLIQSLALAATATAAAGAAVPTADERKRFRAVAVNHISYQVADYARTRDFYADLFGLKVVADTGKQCCLVLNDSNTFIIPRNAPPEVTPPRIDHIAYTIAAWDKNAVRVELERRGLQPSPDTDNSFHVKDPNGFDLQISGKDMTAYG
jgi:catechol 2,3-dioxygenase-like lactoylglutathione lyase family enzyme